MKSPLIACILLGIALGGPGKIHAETEPTDGTSGGATAVSIGTTAMGSIHNSDDDWYKVTNPGGYSSITINWVFQQAGGDNGHYFRVYGPNGLSNLYTVQTSSSGTYRASYTINTPMVGGVYLIELDGQSVDGTQNYTLEVTGMGGGGGGAQQPDMKCASSASGSYVGENIYNTTGSGQLKTISTTKGAPAYCYFAVQNDGTSPSTINVKRTASNTSSFRYTYYNYSAGSANISSKITSASGFTTPILAPGARIIIKVKVEALWTSTGKRTTSFTMSGYTTNGYSPATYDKAKCNFSITR